MSSCICAISSTPIVLGTVYIERGGMGNTANVGGCSTHKFETLKLRITH